MAQPFAVPSPVPPSTTPAKAQLTTLAKKYGHPYKKIRGFSHRILKNTGKSGLTPLSPFVLTMDPASLWQKYRLFYYQQHRYFGMSALDSTPMAINLENPIHPMFSKKKWDSDVLLRRHLGRIPLLGGHDGFWEVSLAIQFP